MTTTTTVRVAGHKVLVTERQVTEGQEGHNVAENPVILENRGQTATFYAHGSNSLVVKELDEASVTDEDIARTNNAG